MRQLVLHITRGLVRESERVRVREHVESDRTLLEVSVSPDDIGRVVGRQGRTASALRLLVGALARRRGGSCALEILER